MTSYPFRSFLTFTGVSIAAASTALAASALTPPAPIDSFSLPAPSSIAFGTSVNFAPDGTLYAYDGEDVFSFNGVDFSNQINTTAFTAAGSDAGPIAFNNNGTTAYVGTGAGGRDFSGNSAGLTFALDLATGVYSPIAGTTPGQFDFEPVPAASSASGSGPLLAVNQGFFDSNTFESSSQVSFFDTGDGSLTEVVSNVPGSSSAVGFGEFGGETSLFVGIGFGADRGEVRRFGLSELDTAFTNDTAIDFADGDLITPAGTPASGTGFFVNDDGYLFIGQGNEGGVLVISPELEVFEFAGLVAGFNGVIYDATTDNFLVTGGPEALLFDAGDFVAAIPEPAALMILAAGGVLGMLRRRHA